jgi:hypothetical protein
MRTLSLMFAIVIGGCFSDDGSVATKQASVESGDDTCHEETYDACIAEYTDGGTVPTTDEIEGWCDARASAGCAQPDGGGSEPGACYGNVFVACYEACVEELGDDPYCVEGCRLRASILCGESGGDPRSEEEARDDEDPRGEEDARDEDDPRAEQNATRL